MATLRCELTKEAPVEWRKGTETLRNGDKYSLKQDGAVCELQICNLVVADAGEYMCVCGQERTSATLAVKGKGHTCDHVGQRFTHELTWRSSFLLMLVHLLFIPPCIPPYSLSLYMSQEIRVSAAGFPL